MVTMSFFNDLALQSSTKTGPFLINVTMPCDGLIGIVLLDKIELALVFQSL